MSERRQVWETLARLLQRVDESVGAGRPAPGDTSGLEQEIRKMGKTQLKSNLLAEEQAARLEKTLAAARTAQEENTRLSEALAAERVAAAQMDLLEAILPALDGLEQAIASGQRYLRTRDRAANNPNLTPQESALVSPADRAVLAGWLDGLALVRERLLAILEAGGVTPIPAVGQLFDPSLHLAVGTTAQVSPGMQAAANINVAEERRGYRTPAGVIRFAEVIVYRPKLEKQ
jgi:molecular chaperone GrpE